MYGQQFGTAQRTSGLGIQQLKRGYLRELLVATFSATIPAPLPASLPIDLGDPMTVVDASNTLSQAGGELVGDGVASSNITASVALERIPGRATRLRYRRSIATTDLALRQIGLNAGDQIRFNQNNFLGPNSVPLDTVTPVGPGDMLIVARSLGVFAFIRTGFTGPYTLLWVDNIVGGAILPRILSSISAAGRINYCTDLRTFDLAAIDPRFGSDFGFAEGADLSTTPGSIYLNRSQDYWMTYTINFVAGVTDANVRVRSAPDGSYYWRIRAQPTGNFTVYELVSGLQTRINTVGLFTTGAYEMRILCEGTNIKIWINNVVQFSTSASAVPVPNVCFITGPNPDHMSNIAAWPRTTMLPEGI
jgi:hypothetical protein